MTEIRKSRDLFGEIEKKPGEPGRWRAKRALELSETADHRVGGQLARALVQNHDVGIESVFA